MISPPRTLVVVPTYNEVENIEEVVAGLLDIDTTLAILIVDDNSPDGTGRVAAGLAAESRRVNVLHRPTKAGLGSAYLDGFRWALNEEFDFVVEIDADGSHPVSELPTLLAHAISGRDDGVGLVIGSRWVPGGGISDWSRHRQLLSRSGNSYVRTVLNIPVRDATAGFRVYSAEALRSIDLSSVHAHGYIFQVSMTIETLDAGFDVVEHPIIFKERLRGTSKMSTAIVVEAMLRVTGWGIRRRFGSSRQTASSAS